MSGCTVKSEDDCDSEGEDSRGKEKGGKERKSATVKSNRSKTAATSAAATASAENRSQASVEIKEPESADSGRSAELAAAVFEDKAKGLRGEDEQGEETSSMDNSRRQAVRDKAELEPEKGESEGVRLDPQIDEKEHDAGRLCRSGQEGAEENDGETEEKYCTTQIPGGGEDSLGGVGVELTEDAKGSLLSGNIIIPS